MPTNTSSLFVRADEGDSLFLASGEFLTWKATGEMTGGRYDQLEFTTVPNPGPPEHIHTTCDEIFYFLAGTYRVKLGGHVFTASAGDFLRIPAGTPHAWRCIGKNVGKILLTYVPGGMQGFFEEVRPLYLAPTLDVPSVMAIAAKYGVEVIGPPLTE